MPGNTEAEARREYHALLQRCLGCITSARIEKAQSSMDGGGEVLCLDSGPLQTQRLPGGISLTMTEWHRVRPDQHHLVRRDEWRVVIDAYRYAVHDADGDELLAWCWLPKPLAQPHMYVSGGPLAELPLPTGPLRLDSVLRFLLHDFGVPPRRPDWKIVLDETELDLAELSRCMPVLGAGRPGFPPRHKTGVRPDAHTS